MEEDWYPCVINSFPSYHEKWIESRINISRERERERDSPSESEGKERLEVADPRRWVRYCCNWWSKRRNKEKTNRVDDHLRLFFLLIIYLSIPLLSLSIIPLQRKNEQMSVSVTNSSMNTFSPYSNRNRISSEVTQLQSSIICKLIARWYFFSDS